MNNSTNDDIVRPMFSRKKIEKAGKTIINKKASEEEIKEALIVLNNWRSAHAFPLKVITDNMRRNNQDALVVERLKRLDSITGKLERFPEMSLYKMQDLGGCRVIVDSIEDVYEAHNRFKESRVRHILKKENDYIRNPKISGYRSYHAVYQYQSDTKNEFNKNILIEVQFRTKLQHVWATAVEVMGVFTRSQLKASMGNEDILRFFTLASSLFALKEGTPICPDTPAERKEIIKEMKEINNKQKIIDKLSAISIAIHCTAQDTETNDKGYYLLNLDYSERTVNIRSFRPSNVALATEIYGRVEAKNIKNLDTVLVAASSLEAVKIAYPNYFADINEFVYMMKQALYA